MTYPDDFINKIIQGDCLEVMKQMPDKSVDLVLTDPPYDLEIDQKKYTGVYATKGKHLDKIKVWQINLGLESILLITES